LQRISAALHWPTRARSGNLVGVAEAVPVRVVAAILRQHERVLLCHRHPDREWYPDVWDLPGGHIERAERSDKALLRELREELAVDLQTPLGLPFRELADATAGVEMTIWLIDYGGAVVNRAPEEHDELRWATFEEIAGLVLAHPSYLDWLRDAINV
jgi:8-oxo-dGTP diphosphatase